MAVVYRSEETKFKDGTLEKSGCVFCTEDFIRLVEKSRAVVSRPVQKGMRGGRGGARGAPAALTTSIHGGPQTGARGRGRPPRDKMAELAAYFV